MTSPGSVSDAEGSIKFRAVHTREPLAEPEVPALVAELDAWRRVLVPLGLMGQDPARYDGAGFGNLSVRLGGGFLISGTQTGGVPRLGPEHVAAVDAHDVAQNTVRSRGLCLPSSESMTHAMLYALAPAVRAVVHVHSPVIWHAAALGLPTTSRDAAYGTPDMAREVARLFAQSNLASLRVLSMAGHEDGIISFGATLDDAALAMVRTLAHAHQVMRS